MFGWGLLDPHGDLMGCISWPLATGRDSEHGGPWGESSPDDYRYGNQAYSDPREREREQHDMNKR